MAKIPGADLIRPLLCELAALVLDVRRAEPHVVVPKGAPLSADNILNGRRAFYGRLLRWCPWWSRGHVRYAQLSLALNDVDGAYVSAHAPFALGSGPPVRLAAKRLIGLCLLKRGAPEKAREQLREVVESARGKLRDDALEDLAATELALGNFEATASLITQIKEARRSAGAKAAYDFAIKRGQPRSS